MIKVNREIEIPESELEISFARSGGPGGQKVNKTSSAVVLKFDVRNSSALPDSTRNRLEELFGNMISAEGVLVIHSRKHRSQSRNRDSAIRKLVKLIRKAARKPKKRKRTKPTKASKDKRIAEKKRRGKLKKNRNFKPDREDFL